MSYEAHMIGVDCSERGKTVSHDGEKSHKHIIDDVDDVSFPVSKINPADQKQYPGCSEKGNQHCINSDEQAECWTVLVLA